MMLNFLAARMSVFEREEFFFVHHAFQMIRPWTARDTVSQDALIERLARERPPIVDTGEHAAAFRTTFSALASHIDAHYQVERTFGSYRVLTWRTATARGASASFNPYQARVQRRGRTRAMGVVGGVPAAEADARLDPRHVRALETTEKAKTGSACSS